MIKTLISAVLVLLAAAATTVAGTTAPTTQTNVLQNIALTLTIYQQGATNPLGTKVADKVTSFTTKNLIAALEQVTGLSFGASPKLVLSTVYSNVTITTGPAVYSTVSSTNLAVTTNNLNLLIGMDIIGLGTNIGTIISNQLTESDGLQTSIATNVVAILGDTNLNVTINTNAGFVTTLTPSTNGAGLVTNIAVLAQQQVSAAPTESILTNAPSSACILYGAGNILYPLSNYLSFSANSPQIVIETGVGLNTTNALTVANLASQTAFSVSNLNINYFTTTSPTNLSLSLTGFVKQTLKVDDLSSASVRGTNRVFEDIFGASATWTVIGSGYSGGSYTTNPTPVAVGNYVDGNVVAGFLTNTTPIVVEGTVNITFFKNLPQ